MINRQNDSDSFHIMTGPSDLGARGTPGAVERQPSCRIDGRLAQRILIVRPSAIGDVVMASPVLRALREACPDAHICWLVEPHLVDVLKTNPCLDQVIVWPKNLWRKLWSSGRWWQFLREICGLARKLRRQRFDVVLDIQGLLRSRLLAWLSGAPVRIGFASKEPGRFLLSRVVSRGADSERMGSEYLHLMRELGFDPGPFHPCLDVDETEAASVEQILREAGLTGHFVAFAPFTTRPQKHWFAERWSELARRVGAQFDLPVVVLGGPADHDAATMICASAGCAVNLAGQLRLVQTMAVIRRCTLLIGVDTGLTHMGPAFERPTIALFGPTCPYRVTSRTNTVVLYHELACSPCRRSPTCDGKYHCMQAITVDEVMANAVALIEVARG